MEKIKKVPMRKCLGCGLSFSKKELMQFRALLRETEKMNQRLCELRIDGRAENKVY